MDKTSQEKKDLLRTMEKQLRLAGQELDALWLKARGIIGLERNAIHQKINLLREKQALDRKEHEALKKANQVPER